MELSQARRNALISTLQRGILPRLFEKAHRYAIAMTGSYHITLVDGNGVTADGQFVYDQLGIPPPTDLKFDQYQTPIRRDGNEYVKLLNGKEALLRSLQADGKWKDNRSVFNQWALVPHAEVTVRCPCTIRGTNDKGIDYIREDSFWPYTSNQFPQLALLAVDSHMTDQQQNQAIINYVKQEKGITNVAIYLEEQSQDYYWYDPTRAHLWSVSKMVTRPTAAGPSVRAILNQPMGALRVLDTSVPFPNMILAVCLENYDDFLCVPRALSALLKKPLELFANSFDYTFDSKWRTIGGLTSVQLMEWCKLEGRNAYCIHRGPGGRWQVEKEIDEENKDRGVAWCYVSGKPGHIYMYEDCHLLASFVRGGSLDEELNAAHDDVSYNLQCDVEPRIRSDYNKEASQIPEVNTWKPWEGQIQPGNFHALDLEQIRRELCQRGRSPQVSTDGTLTRQLSLQCLEVLDGCKGECHIRFLDKNADEIHTWLERIEDLTGVKILWQGEGLSNLTLQVFQILLKASRHSLTVGQKQTIRDMQNNKCAICHTAEIQEFDHLKPVRASFRGEKQPMQGLCKPCHARCTAFQSDQIRIQSQHSPFACRAYLDTPRSHQLVFIANKNPQSPHEVKFDIKRCRFSACCHYDLETFPCFCAFDNILPFDSTNPKLGDMNFVDLPSINGRHSILAEIPYIGPMWYTELECRHALSHGIFQWHHIKATYTATGRIPRASVERVLFLMESCWGGDEDTKNLKKHSWNAAVGCMAKEFLTRYRVISSETALPSFGTKMKYFEFERDGEQHMLYDHTTEQPLVSSFSHRSFHDCIIGWEHVKVAVMSLALQQTYHINRCDILEVGTDCLLVAKVKRKMAELDNLVDLTYEGAGRLSDEPQGLAKYKRAKPAVSYPVREGDRGTIFQKAPKKKKQNDEDRDPNHLQGKNYDVRVRAELQTLSKIWRDIPAPMQAGKLNFDAVLRHVLNGGHIWIDGPGGSGKTTLGELIVSQLRACGKTVVVIAKTHSAVRRFNDKFAQTADKFLNWHVASSRGVLPDVLFCEEISMIDLRLWGYISTIFMTGKNRKCQIILSGDLFQMAPCKNQWNGCDLAKGALKNSDLLFELAGGNRCFLDCNMRSDHVIFEFAKTLRAPGATLDERLAAAKLLFPITRRIPDHMLVISHHKRISFNQQLNDLKRPLNAMRLELPVHDYRDETQPQSMWIWPGMRVVGQRKPCVKSTMYDVVTCDDNEIVLRQVDFGLVAREATMITVPTSKACVSFVMSFATTYCRAQGLQYQGLVCLSDCENQNFTLEMLNMGITRALGSTLVEIR